MKRKQSKVVFSLIAAAVFALITGCASVPSAEVIADDFQAGASADAKP